MSSLPHSAAFLEIISAPNGLICEVEVRVEIARQTFKCVFRKFAKI